MKKSAIRAARHLIRTRTDDRNKAPENAPAAAEGGFRMRRAVLCSAAVIAVFAALASCSPQRSDEGGRRALPPGWVDAVRYRCAGIGEADISMVNRIQRRGIAKAAAVDDAKSVAADRFARLRYRLGGDERVADFMLDRIEAEFGDVIDGGVVIRETYDDDGNCEVVMEISSRELLNRVLGR